MDQQQAAEVLRNLDLRTRRMEQILPGLPTREEVRETVDAAVDRAVAPLATRAEMHEAIQAAVAPLATRAEMHEAIQVAVAPLATRAEMHEAVQVAVAPLATRQELQDVRDELRRHMDVWAERIHEDVRLGLESMGMADARLTRSYEELREHLRELIRTEAQHHVGSVRTYEELRDYWREYVKTHAREHAENVKAIEKLRGRVTNLEAKAPRKRRAS